MGKKAKEHRKKVEKRNERLAVERKKIEKQQKDFLLQLIEKEKAAGKFDNNQTINLSPNGDITSLGQPFNLTPNLSGPQI